MKSATLLPKTIVGLSPFERRTYSLQRAIVGEIERHDSIRLQAVHDRTAPPTGLEAEISNELRRELAFRQDRGGILIPVQINAAGLDTKTSGAGGYSVGTQVPEIVEFLVAQSRVLQLGAELVSGLAGGLQFPVEGTEHSGTWLGENPGDDVAQSDPSFGALAPSPHPYASTTAASRKLLSTTSVASEIWLRRILARAHAQALDAAAINGSGADNEPAGILHNADIGSYSIGADGGAVTADVPEQLERAVGLSNADGRGNGFLTTPEIRTRLRKVPVATGAAAMCWHSDGRCLGYPSAVSNAVPKNLIKGGSSDCHAVIFGDWSQLAILQWGVLEIVVDPYRLKKQGIVEITSYGDYDIIVRHGAAFAACTDARDV